MAGISVYSSKPDVTSVFFATMQDAVQLNWKTKKAADSTIVKLGMPENTTASMEAT